MGPLIRMLDQSTQLQRTNCGLNSEEAQIAGCSFDMMMVNWIPPECFNEQLSLRYYKSLKQPVFFRDENLTEPIDDDPQTLSQYTDFWGSPEYHDVHCFYVIYQGVEAAVEATRNERDVYLMSHATDTGHTEHCVNAIRESIRGVTDPTKINRNNPQECVPVSSKTSR
ncbi:uncharacterized protein BCR38DRAFT_488306 [Pseudomassariella vexata]|uniref:Uncharacterized protein n=1 Tax=Pseudomassariella vexata TaxID=1141098 RepID=A0A1Y2DLC4_9PEZI|nr:uncharacterized protein BCR38DRAFT_488306 [Pseudomassariella vexata]ORY60118.1 hypothetical protein BCR38DRAFT_488306 [Pseudomassariella vexata]